MKNKIYYVSNFEMDKIKKRLYENTSLFIAEMYGSNIKNLEVYFNVVSEIFKFPIASHNFAGYEDWMRDLGWLKKEGYIFIIYEFDKFMEQDLFRKDDIISEFKEIILPWWQDEVEKCVVDGHVKPFKIYLVE
jgi:hypothetical protein